ncbi:MAG: YggS family pyridoxal phosphate-dependent enzyme [Planctomycetota bacterium]
MAQRLPLNLPRFRGKLERIRSRVAALTPAGSGPPRIVIVTKYLEAIDTHRLRELGIGPLGESRAAELEERAPLGEGREEWHFIGHLQRNKIARVIPRTGLLHSLDSARLASAIDHWVEERDPRPCNCLVQVNVSGEEAKGGLAPFEALEEVPDWVESHRNLRILGLMTMAPRLPAEECRPVFRMLRELLRQIAERLPAPAADRFRELSMGMSNDFEVAVEEGSTLLRLGRVLLE